MENGKVSRRGFLTLAGLTVGAGAMGLAGCAPQTGTAQGNAGEALASTGAEESTSTDWIGAPLAVNEDDIVDTRSCDLLIVGAGNGGMVAAATASDLGLDFMVCEKAGAVQASRHWVGAVNTKWHKEANLEIDEKKLLNELTRYASGRCNQAVWNVWINESSEMVDYVHGIMSKAGFDLYLDTEGYDTHGGGTDFYAPPQQHMWFDEQGAALAGGPSPLCGIASSTTRNAVLEEYVGAAGHTIDYGYELVKLEQDDSGRVSGGIFSTEGGYVRVNARKGTLLATGGYPANPDMLLARAPGTVECCTRLNCSPNNTGDGIRLAAQIGAALDQDGATMIFDRGVIAPGLDAGFADGTKEFSGLNTDGPCWASLPFLKVNRRGKRFFNESAPYDWATAAALEQPGGVYCIVFDGKAPQDVVKFSATGCAKIGVFQLAGQGVEEACASFLEDGTMKKADTLDELADELGFTGDAKQTFLQEVERYNGFCEKQVDEDFGKEAFRLATVSEAPFYGIWCGGALLTTIDGVKINENMQVLNEAREPIPGLYAAGDVSGSLFNGNYPEYHVGAACGRTLTFGRHAVRYIAENE